MPDPRHGVFETLLVLDGRPVELDAHLYRLEASLAALYPDLTPPPLNASVANPLRAGSTAGTPAEALRLAVAPDANGKLATTTERRTATGHFAPEGVRQSSTEAVSLRGLTVAGGLGAHKWVDRRLLDEAQASLPNHALPLIIDTDGAALEAARANLFAVRDGALLTPPLDGRILPGITRMRVLESAAEIGIETREASLTRDDLLAADEVFLTGSVRGVERADRLDGATLRGGGELSGRFAAALRRAWTGTATVAQPVG
ncbi:MAG: aminotransferase class IV [Solirubrobacterales bacterium]